MPVLRGPDGATFLLAVSLRRQREGENGGQEIAELAALADGSLDPERRDALEADVASSAELAEQLDEQRRALALVQNAAAEVEAPGSLRIRIDAERRSRSASRPRRFVAIGAAAAVAVVAVAVGVSVLSSGSSPQRFHAALASTPLEPDATGKATLTKTDSGWRISLDATGLPRLDKGRFYEAWLKNGAGVLVPIGTFNEGRNVTLWAGVSPVDFPTLSVTRELADGNQDSSGKKVPVGTVDTSGRG